MMRQLIKRCGWLWTYYVADVIGAHMGSERLRSWRAHDPAVKDRHWRDVLTYFAIARVRATGLLDELQVPALKSCTLCRRSYLDAAIPLHLAELSNFQSSFCRLCLGRAFFFDERLYPDYVGPDEIDSGRVV